MHVEFRRHVLFDGIEKSAELARAMTTMQLSQHAAAGHVESSEQNGGAVALVIVAAAFDLSGAHGQQRRGALQCLNLALLVHAQHQGTVGRMEVEADDVANFVDKQRVAAQLESVAAMGLQRKSAPDPADAALAEAGRLGQGARGPMSGGVRLAFQSARQHAFDFGIAQATPGAGARFIEQSIEAEKNKALPPLAHGSQCDMHAASDLGVAPPLGAEQYDAGAQRQGLRRLGTASPLQQLLSFGRDKSQGRERATESHAVPPAYIRCRKGYYLLKEY